MRTYRASELAVRLVYTPVSDIGDLSPHRVKTIYLLASAHQNIGATNELLCAIHFPRLRSATRSLRHTVSEMFKHPVHIMLHEYKRLGLIA